MIAVERLLHLSPAPFSDRTVCGLRKDLATPYCGRATAEVHRACCEPHVCRVCFPDAPPPEVAS